MKLALAQIDMRLGDIEGICGRIEDQARLAHERGARVLCVPAPLFMGAMPGSLVGAADFEHDMLTGLTGVAERIQELDMICIVPSAVSFEGQPLLDYMMLKDGRVVPARASIAPAVLAESNSTRALGHRPVFDVDGVRIAVVFDLDRELEMLPTGVDLIAYFQFNAFDMTDRETAAIAAVRSGAYRKIASKRSVWFACMAPVGAYDESVYTGGSFVLDDCGRVVAQAPCFEESLLVQEIQRGVMLDALEDHELPQFRSEEWLWQALVLAVRDNARARGASRAVVALEGDLPSSLLAALAVDALGPRNVIGLVLGRNRIFTPAQEEAEAARCSAVRSIAERLHIRTVERDAPDAARVLDRDVSAGDAERLRSRALGLMLEDTALELGAMALSPLSKTEYALAAPALSGGYQGDFAPFGDVYLSTLEFVARVRNRASAVVPQELVTLNAVEDCMDRVLAQALSTLDGPVDMLDRAAQLLGGLEPGEVDGALESHVDRNRPFDDIPMAAGKPEACSLLLILVRQGEAARHMLPTVPIVSARSFAERAWPYMLAWSDLGLNGKERMTVDSLARAEVRRFADDDTSDRMRGEMMGLLGELLGISPEQMEELRSEDGQRRLHEGMKRFEGRGPGRHRKNDGRPGRTAGWSDAASAGRPPTVPILLAELKRLRGFTKPRNESTLRARQSGNLPFNRRA